MQQVASQRDRHIAAETRKGEFAGCRECLVGCGFRGRLSRGGFTLIEVVASLAIVTIILGGILVAFQRTTNNIAEHILDERAVAVAQRRLELLIATQQEPNSMYLSGRDEIDTGFTWSMSLSRIIVGEGAVRGDLSNTVILATIGVTHDDNAGDSEPIVEMARCFSYMTPSSGQAVAVPFTYDQPEELWLIELRQELQREPTLEEILDKMAELGLLPEEYVESFRSLEEQ